MLEDERAGPQIRSAMESWTITPSSDPDALRDAKGMRRLKQYLVKQAAGGKKGAETPISALWPNLRALNIGDPASLLADTSDCSKTGDGSNADQNLAETRKSAAETLRSLIQSTHPQSTISYFPSSGKTDLMPPPAAPTTLSSGHSPRNTHTYLLPGSRPAELPLALGEGTRGEDGFPGPTATLNIFMSGTDPRTLEETPIMKHLCAAVENPGMRERLQERGLYLHTNIQGTSGLLYSDQAFQAFDSHAERISSEPSIIDILVQSFSSMWPQKTQLIKTLGWAMGESPYWLNSTHKFLSKHVTDPLAFRLSQWHDSKLYERNMAGSSREPWRVQRMMERSAKATADFLTECSYSQRSIPSTWMSGWARSPTILKGLERALQPTAIEKLVGKRIPYAVSAMMVRNRSQVPLQTTDPELYQRLIDKVGPPDNAW
jgi:hypothetical protein